MGHYPLFSNPIDSVIATGKEEYSTTTSIFATTLSIEHSSSHKAFQHDLAAALQIWICLLVLIAANAVALSCLVAHRCSARRTLRPRHYVSPLTTALGERWRLLCGRSHFRFGERRRLGRASPSDCCRSPWRIARTKKE